MLRMIQHLLLQVHLRLGDNKNNKLTLPDFLSSGIRFSHVSTTTLLSLSSTVVHDFVF